MPSMGVIGGGPVGLATAMLAADRGWDVVVFERDASSVPASVDEAWESWERSAVAQFRMAHTIMPLGTHILAQHLPDVLEGIRSAGGVDWTLFDLIPGFDRSQVDSKYVSVGARRPIYELAFADAAARRDGIVVRRGAQVEALVAGEPVTDGVVHVAGVVVDGEEHALDVVIDAGGRRSRIPELVQAVGGGEVRVTSEDSRFAYYGRHYRKRRDLPTPYLPELRPVGSFCVLLLPGDNDTWSLTIYSATSDKELRAVRSNDVFDRVVAAIPSIATWADGDPITDVAVMTGVLDRQRDYVVDGVPIATGVVPVGDAWACTNPSQGRGISFGLLHALRTVEAVDANRSDPLAQTLDWHAATQRDVEPWHAATLAGDRRLVAALAAASVGELPPEPTGTDALLAKARSAMHNDLKIFSWMVDCLACYTLPADLLARPGVAERIEEVAAAHPAPPHEPELTREQLEELLAV